MELKKLANHNRVVRLEDWNGLRLDGLTDMQSILVSAMGEAVTAGMPLELPATQIGGGILLGATASIPVGITMRGAGGLPSSKGMTRFIPGMTDGTAGLRLLNSNGTELRDFFVQPTIMGTVNPDLSGGNVPSCIGLQLGKATSLMTGATRTSPTTITITTKYLHTFETGDSVYITDVVGLTGGAADFTSGTYPVTRLSATAFSVDTSGRVADNSVWSSYTSKGLVAPAAGGTLSACRRGVISNIGVEACAVGFHISGWLNEMLGLWVKNSTLGFAGAYLNTCLLDLTTENCYQSAEFNQCSDLHILRIEDEGGGTVLGTCKSPSTIDSSAYLTCDTWATEGTRLTNTPWLTIGEVSYSNDIYILGGHFVEAPNRGVCVAVDNVNGFTLPHCRTGYSTTSNTRRDFSIPQEPNGRNPFATTVPSALKNVALDLMPNPYMEGLRWGCKDAQIGGGSRATISAETTNVRTGLSALRVTAVSGQSNNYFALVFDDPWVASIKGQALTLGAWVYVPPSQNMGSNESPATYIPRVGVSSNGTSAQSSQSTTDVQSGGWTFMHARMATVPLDATEVTFSFYVNLSGNNATGAEYIIVDECHVAVGDCWEAMLEGRIQRSPLAAGFVEAGAMRINKTIARASTMIADTEQTFVLGDQIIYTDPLAGQVEGKILTTTGWKDVGVIAL